MTRAAVLVVVLATASSSLGAEAKAAPILRFQQVDFLHRWSKDGQHEFTPKGQEDLEHWTDMVTIDVHDEATDGDTLAALATQVVARYQAAGKILKTDSKPRTADHPAEHFAAAILPDPAFLEAAFARFLLVEGHGVVAVYSHRVYGKAGPEMAAWLDAQGAKSEQALMAWEGVPAPARLASLR
ncbi:MAG TPA: hypothetical protein VGQ33_06240 [Vicinamibacteria bacterium]|nr:hypothetical protein [Vicinamibacteria bacterium]